MPVGGVDVRSSDQQSAKFDEMREAIERENLRDKTLDANSASAPTASTSAKESSQVCLLYWNI